MMNSYELLLRFNDKMEELGVTRMLTSDSVT